MLGDSLSQKRICFRQGRIQRKKKAGTECASGVPAMRI